MTALQERVTIHYAQFASGLFVVLGVVGLLRTQFDDFAGHDGAPLVGMTVNPLTNVIHLVAGLVGIAMAITLAGSRRYTLGVGIGALLFGLLEFALGDGKADIFGRDDDVALVEIALAVIGLAIWAWTRRAPAADPLPASGRESHGTSGVEH